MAEQTRPPGFEYRGPQKLFCHNCGAVNPPKAYCCLSCFQVLRPKSKPPLWAMIMRPSTSIIILFVIALAGGIFAMKKWIDDMEARFRMDVKTADYNISLVADKRKKALGSSQTQAVLGELEAVEGGKQPK